MLQPFYLRRVQGDESEKLPFPLPASKELSAMAHLSDLHVLEVVEYFTLVSGLTAPISIFIYK